MALESRLIIGNSETHRDLLYACPFPSTGSDAVVFLCRGRQSWLVVPLMERQRAQRALNQVHGRVLTPADLALEAGDRRRISAWALGLLQRLGFREVVVARDFPVAVADALRRARIRVHVVEDRLFPEREIKRDHELICCRASQRAAVAAMRSAARLIGAAAVDRHGRLRHEGRLLTSDRVRDRMDRVLLEHDCSGAETIVSCGPDSALPHHRGEGPLWAGRPIVIDVFPRHRRHGYHGDLTRTLVRGDAPPLLRRMLTAVRAAQRAALSAVRAGVLVSGVHQAAQQVFAGRGMVTDMTADPPRGFIHSTGHGIGLDVHEAPWVGGGRTRLRIGQVVTVEPGWYEPGFGGVRIEDTVVVTRGGYAPLARCPKLGLLDG